MSKVLIITCDFPPNRKEVGWMVRMAELSNYLVRNSHDVNVLTTKRIYEYSGLLSIDPRVKINRIKGADYYSTKFKVLPLWGKVIRLINYSRVKIFKKKYIDETHIDLPKYLSSALRIIDHQNIKNVIISSPPYSLNLLGAKLKKELGNNINLIIDYRDAWTLRETYNYNKSKRLLIFLKNIESYTLNSADWTVFVSDAMCKDHILKFNINKPIVIENGFITYNNNLYGDQVFLDEIMQARQSNRMVIGYFGTSSVNGKMINKDLGNLLYLLDREEYCNICSKICLILQGEIAGFDKAKYKNLEIIKFQTDSNRIVRGNMRQVDICLYYLNKTSHAPHDMGGKIYDYIASGTPIWCVVPNNATSILEFVKKTRKPFISNTMDERSIIDSLRILLKLYEKGKLKDYGFTELEAKPFSRDRQHNKYEKILT